MISKEFNSFKDLYYTMLDRVFFNPDSYLKPRGLKINECQNVLLTLNNPCNNLFHSFARLYPKRYLAGELFWYFSGKNDLKFISQYSSFWKHIANSDGTTNSAYGHLLFKENPCEWNWAHNSLINDKDSRQAIIHFNKPQHMVEGTKDFPCTLVGVFQIRENKLNFTINMRSQDMIKGLTFDLPFFTVLQQCMLNLLINKYENLSIGKFTLFVNSLHIYISDNSIVTNILKSPIYEDSLPILHNSLIDKNGNFCPYDEEPLYEWIKRYM